ncbi:MAG: methylenetetrahydrofolate--tRNA-(uracil(54)-C(5))-methyltransferase (FADH(2)-oxidizing) TrmFO, partial [Alicyclobacillus shizuokensis]|nr:methylenetetrahydrofolate--tRNA-(uracil(54)-C(5))-methyltransferase (FADH(2)-oxidizing) TrmFO [Alicyclobacillus shizuokensis]
MRMHVTVIGAGLAGSEAAWQAARQGASVTLYEMRPLVQTPAHHTSWFAELVCTNSLRSNALTNAVGLLKEEMRRLDSLIMRAADANAVPAGSALAVDREGFAQAVTRALEQHPRVTVRREEVRDIPTDGIVVVATGPLTSPGLSTAIERLVGGRHLYFYDAASPIVTSDSIDREKVFAASRYGKGEAAYLNCPLDEKQFEAFYEALVTAETAPLHD